MITAIVSKKYDNECCSVESFYGLDHTVVERGFTDADPGMGTKGPWGPFRKVLYKWSPRLHFQADLSILQHLGERATSTEKSQ